MSNYVCDVCGKDAYYDGRCGDGVILMCKCRKGKAIDKKCYEDDYADPDDYAKYNHNNYGNSR